MRKSLVLITGLLLLAGCLQSEAVEEATDDAPDDAGTEQTNDSTPAPGDDAREAGADDEDDTEIQAPGEDVDPSVAANSVSDFGLDFFHGLVANEPSENVISSPYSAAMFLMMFLEGADGETREAIADVLHLEDPYDDHLVASYQALAADMLDADPDVELSIANAIWANEQIQFEDAYRDAMVERFRAAIETRDLGSQETADEIDQWVAEQTRDRIDGVADDLGLPDPMTLVVVANATYFLGNWTDPFDPDETVEGQFNREDGETVTVPMMEDWANFSFVDHDDFTMLRLPYGESERFAMDFILPGSAGDIAGFSQSLERDDWEAAAQNLQGRPVEVSIPTFELEYDTEQQLPELLSELGMGVAFDESADFTRMSKDATWMGDVIQKTYLRVDEEGTEAAAVTAGDMPVSEPPSFSLDRPFVTVISDTENDTILFLGQVTDPSE